MTIQLIRSYAMYVIGEVESGWNWTAVNYNDAITLGMMQLWGANAAAFLTRVRNQTPSTDWDYLLANAPTLTTDVINHPSSEYDWWKVRYLTKTEGNALIHIMASDANHILQQQIWNERADAYVDKLVTWGMSEANYKELIFGMSMYHQRPVSCGHVLSAVSGNSTLDRLYAGVLNDPILGKYRTRYTTVYNRLKAWNGYSDPPDFGQVQSIESPDDSGGDNPPAEIPPETFGYLVQSGDTLILYGNAASNHKNGVVFHQAGAQRWVSSISIPPVEVPSGTNAKPPDPTLTPAEIAANMLTWLVSKVGTFKYSQGAARLQPESSGYTDCSGLMWYVYDLYAGINIGTWTGAQVLKGTEIWAGSPTGAIPHANLRVGDLVFYYSTTNRDSLHHVEMYMGNSGTYAEKVIGHGSGMGPTIKSSINRSGSDPFVTIRRYI